MYSYNTYKNVIINTEKKRGEISRPKRCTNDIALRNITFPNIQGLNQTCPKITESPGSLQIQRTFMYCNAITSRFQLTISWLNIKLDGYLSKNWLKCTFDRSLRLHFHPGTISHSGRITIVRHDEKHVSPIDIGCKISCIEHGTEK